MHFFLMQSVIAIIFGVVQRKFCVINICMINQIITINIFPQWKEVVVKNYEKSLDHRSFYFKQQDKRVVQQRCLVGEIKAAMELQAGRPDGSISGGESGLTEPDDLKQQEVTRAVSSEFTPFLAGMTPHLVLKYNAQDYSVHRDIYRLLCLSAEHGSGSSSNHIEKERIPSLWRDLFRVRFTHFLVYFPFPTTKTLMEINK